VTSFYIAGASSERDRARTLALNLELRGHNITVPWWEQVEQKIAAGQTEASLSHEERMDITYKDLIAGVMGCHTFIILLPNKAFTKGAWGELGGAIVLQYLRDQRDLLTDLGREMVGPHRIVIVGDDRDMLFAAAGDYFYHTEEDFLSSHLAGPVQ
jgi:hypothetical protein